jgi:hypothetical protein
MECITGETVLNTSGEEEPNMKLDRQTLEFETEQKEGREEEERGEEEEEDDVNEEVEGPSLERI